MDDWLDGGLGDVTEREAARELALRWLRAFGPGTSTDLQWWMGWTVAVTRQALADCEAVEVRLDEGPGWVAPGDEAEAEPVASWVALLPSLDPTTMGWKERDWYLPAAAAQAFDRMGNAGPTIWVDGQVAGVWAQTKDGEIRTHFFAKPTASRRRPSRAGSRTCAGMIGTPASRCDSPAPCRPRWPRAAPSPD